MLLEKYLPRYTFREYHEIELDSTKEKAYEAAENLDFSNSKVILFLFALRGLPTRNLTLKGFVDQVNFTFLEEIPGEEFIIGFWAKTRIEKIDDRDRFIEDNTSPRLKVVWNFKVEETAGGKVLLSTETRVYCIAMITKIFFSLYWAVIRPFSGLIRIKMLKIIKESIKG